MADLHTTVNAIASAATWDARIALVRTIPEEFGIAQQRQVYAALAKRAYASALTPNFAYLSWRDDYELKAIERAYDRAVELTDGFIAVDAERLEQCVLQEPRTLLIFRLLLGLLPQEIAATTRMAALDNGLPGVSASRIKSMEAGSSPSGAIAKCLAQVIVGVMGGTLFPSPEGSVRSKTQKPDTSEGWASVREFTEQGVPLPVLLHQRHYGGAFGQLLNATSRVRGNLLEDAVQELFEANGVLFLRDRGGKPRRDRNAVRLDRKASARLRCLRPQ